MLHLARVVSPESFGLWNLAHAWILYLFRIGELGLEVVGIRAIVQGKSPLGRIVWTVVALRLLILLVLIFLVAVFWWLDWFPTGSSTLIMILSLTLLPLALLLEWVYESHQTVASVSAVRVFRGALFLVLVYSFVSYDDQINSAAFCYVGSILLATMAIGWLAVRRFRLLPVQTDRALGLQLFKEGLPVGIATVLANYSFFVGTLFIGYLIGGKELGYFTAAHRLIVFFWAYGIATAHRVLLPHFSRLFYESSESLGEFVFKVARVMTFFSLPLCVIAITGGDQLILLLYGSRYSESAVILKIFSGVFVISIIRSVFEIGLLASHRQKQFLQGMVGVALATTALTFTLIQFHGIEGAAWASLMIEIVYALYLFRMTDFASLLRIMAAVGTPMVLAAITAVVLLLSGVTSLLLVVPLGTGLYFLLLVAARQMTIKDIQLGLNMLGMKLPARLMD